MLRGQYNHHNWPLYDKKDQHYHSPPLHQPQAAEGEEDQHKTGQCSVDHMHHQGPEKHKFHKIKITEGASTLVGRIGKEGSNKPTRMETLNLPSLATFIGPIHKDQARRVNGADLSTEVESEVSWQANTKAEVGFLQPIQMFKSGPHAPHQLTYNQVGLPLVPEGSSSHSSTSRRDTHHNSVE